MKTQLAANNPTGTSTAPENSSRLLFIDNIRILLTLLVIMHHTAITYGAEGSWYYLEHTGDMLANRLLSSFTGYNQIYFMGFFFLISGYFTYLSLEKKGALSFIKNRFLCLGIPLLIYVFTVNPVLEYIKCLPGIKHTFWDFYNYNTLHFRNLPTGIMWFVEALLIFSCIYALFFAFVRTVKKDKPSAAYPLTYKGISLCVIFLSLFTFIVRIWFPMGKEVHNFQLAYFPQYITLFIAGILCCQNNWFSTIPNKLGKTGFISVLSAILLAEIITGLTGAFEDDLFTDGGFYWQSFVTSLYQAIYCVGMCLGLLVLFRNKFDMQNKLAKLFSKNAFTIYVLHGIIIVTLAYSLRHFSAHPLFKFGIVSLGGILISFALSQLIMIFRSILNPSKKHLKKFTV